MSSKNNPDVRKAAAAASTSAPPMANPKVCFDCGGHITHVKDQTMVKVYTGGKGRMQARHKNGCPAKAA